MLFLISDLQQDYNSLLLVLPCSTQPPNMVPAAAKADKKAKKPGKDSKEGSKKRKAVEEATGEFAAPCMRLLHKMAAPRSPGPTACPKLLQRRQW